MGNEDFFFFFFFLILFFVVGRFLKIGIYILINDLSFKKFKK